MKKNKILGLLLASCVILGTGTAFASELELLRYDVNGDKLVRSEEEPLDLQEVERESGGQDFCVKTIIEPLSEVKEDESFRQINLSSKDIVPFATDKIVNKRLSDSDGNQSVKFNLTDEMPHYKIWIDNTSSSDYNVTVTYKTSTGDVIESFEVPAHNRATKYYSGNLDWFRSTKRYVNITSSDGSELSGTVAIRIGSTLDELY